MTWSFGIPAGVTPAALADKVAKGELVLNVEDFGAVGDGTTDDTAAIQAALDAAAASVAGVVGGVVLVPKGAYKTTAALTMASRVSLVGAGATTSTIRTTTNNHDVIQIVGTSGTHKSQTYIRDLGLIGPGKASGSTGVGLSLEHLTGGASFERMYIADMGSHGIDQAESYNVTFRDVLVTTCGGNGFHGVEDINNTVWDRCMFLSNALAGFHVDGGASGLIVGCDFEGNTGSGIELLYTNNYVVLGAEIENNGSDGTQSGIYVHWRSGAGEKASMTSIIGSTIMGTSVATYGVRVDGANLTYIHGNQIADNITAHISTTANASRTVVGVNAYVGSPASGSLSDSSTSTGILDFNSTGLTMRTNAIEFQAASTPGVAAAGQVWYSSGLGRLRHRDASAVRDFCSGVNGTVSFSSATINAQSTLEASNTVASATTASKVAISTPATLPAGLVAMAYVSAAGTVTVRLANVTGSNITNFTGTFNVQTIV